MCKRARQCTICKHLSASLPELGSDSLETVSRVVVGVRSSSCNSGFDGAIHSRETKRLDRGQCRCTEEQHVSCSRNQGEVVSDGSDRVEIGVWDRRKWNE